MQPDDISHHFSKLWPKARFDRKIPASRRCSVFGRWDIFDTIPTSNFHIPGRIPDERGGNRETTLVVSQ